LLIQHISAIKQQYIFMFVQDGFYGMCASGKTARIFVPSAANRVGGPSHRSGIKDREAGAVFGKVSCGEESAEHKKYHH